MVESSAIKWHSPLQRFMLCAAVLEARFSADDNGRQRESGVAGEYTG